LNQLIPLESEASPTLPASFPRYPYVTGRIPPKSISCGRPMSLLSFLGASLTGTSLLLRGSHGAFSFRKGWPASLQPIPPPPLPIRTGTPAIPPRSISPWSSRRTHTPHIPPSGEVAVAACAGRVEGRRCSRTRPKVRCPLGKHGFGVAVGKGELRRTTACMRNKFVPYCEPNQRQRNCCA